ncbi:MAG: AI-2E family transporter [Phycisphaera sp.]|nr:AI-2E family transporter [Phycisphaera sp.]
MTTPQDESPRSADTRSRDFSRLHVWQVQGVRDCLLVVVVLSILWLGYQMSAITVPLLVALGLAYLFEPVIALIQNRLKFGRTTAVSLILAAFMLGVVVVVVPVCLVVIGQTASFVSNAADGRYADGLDKAISLLPESTRNEVQKGKAWIEETLPWSAGVFGDEVKPAASEDPDPDTAKTPAADPTAEVAAVDEDERIRALVREEVSKAMSEQPGSLGAILGVSPTAAGGEDEADEGWSFGSSAFDLVGAGARRIWGFVLALIELGLVIFLVPFYFFFFATAYPSVLAFMRELVPHEHREQTFHLVHSMERAVSGFIRGRLVISAILGTIFAIGWLVVGVPYSLALGLVVGIFCAVPYLSIIGVPVAIGLLAVDQVSVPEAERYAWWAILLWPSLVYMVGQSLDDWVLTPLIQGKVTDLDPVSIVVAVLAGGTLAGLYGMLLAVPAAACIKILLREVAMPAIREWSDGRSKDPLPGG